MSAPRSAAQLPRTPVSLGRSFRPQPRGRGRGDCRPGPLTRRPVCPPTQRAFCPPARRPVRAPGLQLSGFGPIPQTIGLQRVKRPSKNVLTIPKLCGIYLPVMQNADADCGTLQMRNGELVPPSSWRCAPPLSPPGAGGPRGRYRGLQNAKAIGLSDRNTFSFMTLVNADVKIRGECSLMFAYVRLIGKKMFAAPDGETQEHRWTITDEAPQTVAKGIADAAEPRFGSSALGARKL
jgi:hypothetical protein